VTGDYGHLFLPTEFLCRDRLHLSSTRAFNVFGTRAFVDHGLVHHLYVGDVDRLVDDRGVVDDDCFVTHGLQHPRVLSAVSQCRHRGGQPLMEGAFFFRQKQAKRTTKKT
jgi:hypothetical protein